MQKKLLFVVVGALAGGSAVAVPAVQAAARDGVCEPGEFCYFFNSNQQGSVSDFSASLDVYGAKQPECYEYRGPGAGKDRCVKNAAASVWNRTTGPVTVFFNTGYKGPSQTVAAGAKENLNATLKNQNASHRFGAATTATPAAPSTMPASPSATPTTQPPATQTALSYALYMKPGGSISCGFDGYEHIAGRHQGIDITRSIGSPVHALLDGKVINVSRGANGGASHALSTIAVYNARYDKTIIYLHSAPMTTLKIGASIKRGQEIATEAWRGISKSTSHHTHVEMRLGRRTNAAFSVGVKVKKLANPNPYPFWRARGYSIK